MDEPTLPRWTAERVIEEAERAPGDDPFRAPGRADPRVTMALTQSIVRPSVGRLGVVLAPIGAALVAGFYAAGIAWPLAPIAGVVAGVVALRHVLQPRLVVRAGTDGVEVVQSRPKIRHVVARREVRELEVERGAGFDWRVVVIDQAGARHPIIVSRDHGEAVALAEAIAAALGLTRA